MINNGRQYRPYTAFRLNDKRRRNMDDWVNPFKLFYGGLIQMIKDSNEREERRKQRKKEKEEEEFRKKVLKWMDRNPWA